MIYAGLLIIVWPMAGAVEEREALWRYWRRLLLRCFAAGAAA